MEKMNGGEWVVKEMAEEVLILKQNESRAAKEAKKAVGRGSWGMGSRAEVGKRRAQE
jgi:hypothetical protein